MPEGNEGNIPAQEEDRGLALGFQNLAASVMSLEASYRDLLNFTGNIIATLAIERNQEEFAKIPVFHEMAKLWVERYRLQFGKGRAQSPAANQKRLHSHWPGLMADIAAQEDDHVG